jgi:replication factor C subunit 1
MPSRSDSLKANFKKPGKNGMNVFRGVMITGPPGIGKTTSAHLCVKLAGFTPIELNASDARSKKLVEVRCFFSPSESSQTSCITE